MFSLLSDLLKQLLAYFPPTTEVTAVMQKVSQQLNVTLLPLNSAEDIETMFKKSKNDEVSHPSCFGS